MTRNIKKILKKLDLPFRENNCIILDLLGYIKY